MIRQLIGKLALAAVFGLLAAAPAFAQDAQAPGPDFDSRWTPYLGCWRVAAEQLGRESVPVAPGLMVCVRPSGRSGVAISTTVDGKSVLEQTIVADGSTQPMAQGDCQGTQTSEWSQDGERLFTRVELQCAGRPKRTVSGITQMTKGYWVDAQATVVDGSSDVRLRRYRRTSDSVSGTTGATGAPMSVEDVIEASRKVLSAVVEAALVEAGGRFQLDRQTLKQLADAGVSPNVIDLMVAQAYPDRFQVERPSTYPSAPSASGTSYGTGSGGSSMTVFMGSSMYSYPYYDPLFNSYYYYSPFAYPYYWGAGYIPYRYGYPYGYRNYYYNNYYGYPGSIYYGSAGSRGPSGGTAQPGSPDSHGGDGVVVNGRGYTRVRPAGSSGSDSGGSTAGERSVPVRGVRGVSRGSDSSSSGSSGGTISSGGYSSGGSSSSSSGGGSSSSSSGSSGGDGGRTAQPR
jgi:hypothetical protein